MTSFRRTTPAPEPAAAPDPGEAAPPQRVSSPTPVVAVPHWLATGAQYGWRLLVLAAAVVSVVYALAIVRVVVLPLIFAVMFTAVLRQPVSWLHRKGWPESVAAAAVVLGCVAIFVGLLTFAGHSFYAQLNDLGPRLSDGWDHVDSYLKSHFNFDAKAAYDSARASGNGVGAKALHGAVTAAELVVMSLLTVFFTFFLTKDGARLGETAMRVFGAHHRPQVRPALERAWFTASRYMRGVATVAAFDALATGVALLVIGIPLVGPLVVITFIGSLIPLVGPITAGAVSALVALANGSPTDAILIIAACVLIQQVEGHVLQPLILGRVLNLHPIVIAGSVAVGGIVGGIPGAFLAVPLVAVTTVVLAELRRTPGDATAEAEIAVGG
ncbi:MAG: putative heme transporter [Frankiaceae bacterium]|nr:putative heme transporter [Frankiaceae bacterium]